MSIINTQTRSLRCEGVYPSKRILCSPKTTGAWCTRNSVAKLNIKIPSFFFFFFLNSPKVYREFMWRGKIQKKKIYKLTSTIRIGDRYNIGPFHALSRNIRFNNNMCFGIFCTLLCECGHQKLHDIGKLFSIYFQNARVGTSNLWEIPIYFISALSGMRAELENGKNATKIECYSDEP